MVDALRLIGRALRLRCPHCGVRGLFRRWVNARASCPRCHLLLDRGEADYFIGSFTLNFIVAELAIVVAGGAFVWAVWPDVPWTALEIALVALMIPFPVFTYPFAKLVWLAIDLAIRPPRIGDFAGHGENAPPGHDPSANRPPPSTNGTHGP
jgi:uncharacterized protein (DUF983 family)